MSIQHYTVITTKALVATPLPEHVSVIGISRNDGKKGKSGLCMAVEAITANQIQAMLLNSAGEAWMRSQLEGLQSGIASKASGSVIGKTIDSKLFSVEAMLAAMQAEVASQRLSKESIGEWFDSDLRVLWALRIADKLPSIAEDKLLKLLDVLKESYQQLAGREVSMEQKKVEQLASGIAMLDDEYSNAIADKISAKLAALAVAVDPLDLLEGV